MKYVQVKLSDEGYTRLRENMNRLRVETVQDAVLAAIKAWPNDYEGPFANLTPAEHAYLGSVLEYVRKPEEDGILMPVLDELVNRQRRRKRQRKDYSDAEVEADAKR